MTRFLLGRPKLSPVQWPKYVTLTSARPDHKVKAAASATKSKWPLEAVIASFLLFFPLCAGRWKSCADLVFTCFNEGVGTGEGRRAAFYVLPPVGGGEQSKVAEVDAKELAGAGGEGREGLNEAVTTAVQHFRPTDGPVFSNNAAAAPPSHLCPVFIPRSPSLSFFV